VPNIDGANPFHSEEANRCYRVFNEGTLNPKPGAPRRRPRDGALGGASSMPDSCKGFDAFFGAVLTTAFDVGLFDAFGTAFVATFGKCFGGGTSVLVLLQPSLLVLMQSLGLVFAYFWFFKDFPPSIGVAEADYPPSLGTGKPLVFMTLLSGGAAFVALAPSLSSTAFPSN